MRDTLIHITESLARGGTETLLVGVIQSLTQYKHVVISLKQRNDFHEELNGITIHYLNLKGYHSIPKLVNKVSRLVRSYEKNAIVHSHMFWANIIARLAVPSQMPLLNSYHSVSYGPQGANYPLHAMLLDRFTYNKRITTICVSAAVRENARRYIGIREKVHVLYNFINDVFYQDNKNNYVPGNILRMVSVGNLKLQKNYKITVQAMGLLKKMGILNCTLDVFGNGPLLESLRNQAKECGISNLHFKGSVPNIADRLKEYDVYLLSSTYEGFGIAVAEAMAAGLPVVVSNLPVLHEVTGDHALFFDSGKPEELANHIESIATGKTNLASLVAAGKEKAETYRKKNYMDRLTEIYTAIK